MKSFAIVIIVYFLLLFASAAFAQPSKVTVTGVRFSYPLVEKWIHDFKVSNPDAEISIEPRSTSDPSTYDILIEAYEPDAAIKEKREYLYLGRYALLPFANSTSEFAKVYGDKGLTSDQIEETFFHNVVSEKKKQIKVPVTVYTRVQKAGAPITFAQYFGFQQQDINGKAIAGADEHLVKAVLKDSTGVSYASINLLFDLHTRNALAGLTLIPVDLDGNGRVTDNEKITGNADALINLLEAKKVKNVPVEYLHISIAKTGAKPEALKFVKWILYHSSDDLHQFGFLKPDEQRFEEGKIKFEALRVN